MKPPGLATLTQAEANLRLPASVRCLSWPEGWDLSLLLVERVRGSQLLAGGCGWRIYRCETRSESALTSSVTLGLAPQGMKATAEVLAVGRRPGPGWK